MTKQLYPILKTTIQKHFTRGNRTYFVLFHFNGLGEGLSEGPQIEYGVCVLHHSTQPSLPEGWEMFEGALRRKFYTNDSTGETTWKRPISHTELVIKGHFETAQARYTHYPVKCQFTKPSDKKPWFPKYLTRQSLTHITDTRAFETRLINIFCRNGARNRPLGIKSLRRAEFLDQIRSIDREQGRALNIKQRAFSKYNINHPKQYPPLSDNSEDNEEEDDTFTQSPHHSMVFQEKHRTVHIVYQHLPNGRMNYGACFFRPITELDIQNYCLEAHLNTAHDRMTHHGVKTTIPSSMWYTTRSTEISEHDTLAWKTLRKAVSKHGVRTRGKGQPNFITPHLINTAYSSTTKHLNRQKDIICKEFSDWNATKLSCKLVN